MRVTDAVEGVQLVQHITPQIEQKEGRVAPRLAWRGPGAALYMKAISGTFL